MKLNFWQWIGIIMGLVLFAWVVLSISAMVP